MIESNADVAEFIAQVTPAVRKRDAETLIELMSRVTGHEARMWGPSIIGFGRYHYKYPSGLEGDAGAAGFSPRKAATTIYLPDGVGAYEAQLAKLGPHTTGLVCVYIKKLDHIDLGVLKRIIEESYRTVTAGTFEYRAKESFGGRPTS